MKNKKLIAIIITASLMLTACQSSKANIGASTEVSGDSTSVTETTVSTSSVETSEVSTEESKAEELTPDEQKRKEYIDKLKTFTDDDTAEYVMEVLGDDYVNIGSGVDWYVYTINDSEIIEVYPALNAVIYNHDYIQQIQLNGKVDIFSDEFNEKVNKLTDKSTLDDVEKIFGKEHFYGGFVPKNETEKISTYKYECYCSEDNRYSEYLEFAYYNSKLELYISRIISIVDSSLPHSSDGSTELSNYSEFN